MDPDTGVNFECVAGVDEAKEELKEIVDFLRDNGVFHVSDAEAYDLVKFFDSDGNGKLSF